MSQQSKKTQGKKTIKMSDSERLWEEMRDKAAFFDPGCSLGCLKNYVGSIASEYNEHQGNIMQHAKAPPSGLTGLDIRVFSCFLISGLVPPMSYFFQAVMAAFSLRLAQLHPNALLALSTFRLLLHPIYRITP